MSTFIIYDINKGGYTNWSSNNVEKLAIEYAFHYYDSVYYPQKKKFIDNLSEFLNKNKDTIHFKILSDDFIDKKIFEFAFGEKPISSKKSILFLIKNGFLIKQIDKELSVKIDDVFGHTNHDVVSLSDLEE